MGHPKNAVFISRPKHCNISGISAFPSRPLKGTSLARTASWRVLCQNLFRSVTCRIKKTPVNHRGRGKVTNIGSRNSWINWITFFVPSIMHGSMPSVELPDGVLEQQRGVTDDVAATKTGATWRRRWRCALMSSLWASASTVGVTAAVYLYGVWREEQQLLAERDQL